MPDRDGEGRRRTFRRWLADQGIAEGSLPAEVRAVLSAHGSARPSAKEERLVLERYRASVVSQRPRPTGGQARAIGLLQGALAVDNLADTRDGICSALAVLRRTAEQHAGAAARKRDEARSRTAALALRETVKGGGPSAVERRRARPGSGLGVYDPLRALPPAAPQLIAQLVERARELGDAARAAVAPPPAARWQQLPADPTLLRAVSTAQVFARDAAGRLPKWPAGLLADADPADVLELCALKIGESLSRAPAARAGGACAQGHVSRADAEDAMRALYAHAPIVHMFVELVGMAYASHSHDDAAAALP